MQRFQLHLFLRRSPFLRVDLAKHERRVRLLVLGRLHRLRLAHPTVEDDLGRRRAHCAGDARFETNFRALLRAVTADEKFRLRDQPALIAMLLLKYLQLRARFGWSLSNLAALIRQQLFVYRDLFDWIDQPFQPPPLLASAAARLRRRADRFFLVNQLGQQKKGVE